MPRKAILAAAALLLAAPALAQRAAPAPAGTIAVGQVLNDTLGKVVNGWTHNVGAMFKRYETRDGVTTGTLDCCVAVFSRGSSYIVARTEPLARTANGGVIREKVIAVQRLDLRPGEIETTCDLFNLDIAMSVRNPKTNWVRSVVISYGEIQMLEWRDTSNRCGEES
ncbi:MAG TPA: hypothetical protein VFV30_05190 [Novosphingobium sp.]|nr:hypothetical protein [Novosphingobium sp.]